MHELCIAFPFLLLGRIRVFVSASVKNEIPGAVFRKQKLHSVKCRELCKKLRGQLHIKIAVDRAVLTHRFDGGGNLVHFRLLRSYGMANPAQVVAGFQYSLSRDRILLYIIM